MHKVLATSLASIFVLGSSLALAEGAAEFGKAGQIHIGSGLQLSYSAGTTKAPSGDSADKPTTFTIQPGLDYFLQDNISIGGTVGYTSTSQKSGGTDVKSSAISIGPRVGYNVAVAEKLSVWPRAGLMYSSISADFGGGSKSGSTMSFELNVPLLVHLAPHFDVGFGPFYRSDISSKFDGADANKDTTYGLATEIGGWF